MPTKDKEDVVVSTVASNNQYAEAAQACLQETRKMREQIPRFVLPKSPKETSRLTSAASVSPEFVELTNVAKANQEELVRGRSLTLAEMRDLSAFADAFDPVADEYEAMAQFVRHSVTAARNQVGFEALTTYELVKRLAKRPEFAGLVPYVADMRRALGRVKKATPEQVAAKKAKKAAKAQAAPKAQPADEPPKP